MPTLHAGINPKTGKARVVDFTDGQYDRLGFAPKERPQKLGCGNKACAYLPTSGGHVVKVTSDERDAVLSILMKKHPGGTPPWVIPIFDVYRLGSGKFVIKSALAEPLPDDLADDIDRLFGFTNSKDAPLRAHEWRKLYDMMLDKILRDELENDDPTTPEIARRSRYALKLVDQAVTSFARMGLDWADWHSANWGWHDGRPKVLDLGSLSAFRAGQRPPVPYSEVAKVVLPILLEIPVLPY